jgi:hypothetical protein
MSKIVKEDCKNFSIYNLKKWGVIKNNYYSGSIIWTNNHTGKEDNIQYILNLENQYLEVRYKLRHDPSEEWKSIEYQIPLTKTACHFGKERYWFICPMSKKGQYCGKRVAKLYLSPYHDYFVCRHCLNLTYDSRNKNRRGRYGYVGMFLELDEEVRKLEEQIKIPYRAGKPTKKYRRLIKKSRLFGASADMVNKTFLNIKSSKIP